jgi:hypothetical protein
MTKSLLFRTTILVFLSGFFVVSNAQHDNRAEETDEEAVSQFLCDDLAESSQLEDVILHSKEKSITDTCERASPTGLEVQWVPVAATLAGAALRAVSNVKVAAPTLGTNAAKAFGAGVAAKAGADAWDASKSSFSKSSSSSSGMSNRNGIHVLPDSPLTPDEHFDF